MVNRVLHSQINSWPAAEVQPIYCEKNKLNSPFEITFRSLESFCLPQFMTIVETVELTVPVEALRAEKIWQACLLLKKRLKIKDKFLIVIFRLMEQRLSFRHYASLVHSFALRPLLIAGEITSCQFRFALDQRWALSFVGSTLCFEKWILSNLVFKPKTS